MIIEKLTPEDLRYAKPIILEKLTGIAAPCFFHWTSHRSLTDPSAERIAKGLRMTVEEVRLGFKLRRMDYVAAKERESRLEALVA